MNYCNAGVKATITYYFNQEKRIFTTKDTPLNNIEIIQGNPEGELIGYGSRAIVPHDWAGADVYLFGIGYTAPNYPNCPSAYYEAKVGEASPGQSLHINWVPFPDACYNAVFANIPEIGYENTTRQHPGKSVGIGLKKKSKKCQIKITTFSLGIFQDTGDCPIKFEIACGDECPEGYLKCDTPGYPGYCCISCAEVQSEIQSALVAVRSINHK